MSTFTMHEMARNTEGTMLKKTSKGHGKRDRSNTQSVTAQQTGKSSAEHPVSGDNSISSDSRGSDASSQSTSCFHSPQKKKLHSVPNFAEEEDHTTQRNTIGESTQDMTMEDDGDDQELMPFPNGRINLQDVFSASSEGSTQLPEIEIQPPPRIGPSIPPPIDLQNSDGLGPDSSTELQDDDSIPGSDGAPKNELFEEPTRKGEYSPPRDKSHSRYTYVSDVSVNASDECNTSARKRKHSIRAVEKILFDLSFHKSICVTRFVTNSSS